MMRPQRMTASLVQPTSLNMQNALAAWNDPMVAYIRPEVLEGERGYSIYSIDGEHLGHLLDRDTAFAAAIQYSMVPMSVN